MSRTPPSKSVWSPEQTLDIRSTVRLIQSMFQGLTVDRLLGDILKFADCFLTMERIYQLETIWDLQHFLWQLVMAISKFADCSWRKERIDYR